MTEEFKFDLGAKRTRLTDGDLLQALESAAETLGEGYFASTRYDKLSGKRPHSATVIERFGSWKKALALIGIEGGRERRHEPGELIKNLEEVWKELGFPPGKRQIARLGKRISETPYKRYWGSVRGACEALAAFHDGRITREQLLAGNADRQVRETIPLKDRWAVLKRDNYRCAKCGAAPSNDHSVELEVDHVVAVARGGSSDLANLQTLCRKCNQGKKDR
ncbi:MAG: homing endonuclease associated repeat-containing protein [Gammaproteobacteria bacterium]